jgi:hypothetical protein
LNIETDYFIITQEQHDEFNPEAEEVSVSLDYYLMEFCTITE